MIGVHHLHRNPEDRRKTVVNVRDFSGPVRLAMGISVSPATVRRATALGPHSGRQATATPQTEGEYHSLDGEARNPGQRHPATRQLAVTRHRKAGQSDARVHVHRGGCRRANLPLVLKTDHSKRRRWCSAWLMPRSGRNGGRGWGRGGRGGLGGGPGEDHELRVVNRAASTFAITDPSKITAA